MSARFSSRPYTEIAAEVKAACAWLRDLGFDSQSTRFGYYERFLSQLSRHAPPETVVQWTRDEYTQFFEVAVDADELCRIYRGLGTLTDEGIVARVRRAIKGHNRITLEDKNGRTGRDFSFELATAASFVSRGLDVDFGTEADARIAFPDIDIFIECKRPASDKGIEESIRKGLNQLRTRFDGAPTDDNARGVLVVSIARCVNPSFLQLVAPTPDELSDLAAVHVADFVRRFQRHWNDKWDNRVIAVVVVLDIPAYITELRQEFVAHETGVKVNSQSITPIRDLLLLHNLGWSSIR